MMPSMGPTSTTVTIISLDDNGTEEFFDVNISNNLTDGSPPPPPRPSISSSLDFTLPPRKRSPMKPFYWDKMTTVSQSSLWESLQREEEAFIEPVFDASEIETIFSLNVRLIERGRACEEIRSSEKLKEVMKNILYLGNTLNQGTKRGDAVGFKLDSLLKLSETRAPDSDMTLIHYLCKVLASKAPVLLDFHKDLQSLESASKIEVRSLAEEMQDINKGLDNLDQELNASERDGPVSEVFCNKLKDFKSIADAESIRNVYSDAGRKADALLYYFSEDPNRCGGFEQVIMTLLKFVRLFKMAHKENVNQGLQAPPQPQPHRIGGHPPPPPSTLMGA